MRTRQRRRAQAGTTATEYLIVASLLAIAIAIGAERPLEQLARTIADHYQRFTYAVSLP